MTHPTRAMVLAAGLGTRMAPITHTRPKPLVEVLGKPLIDYSLDHLVGAGIRHIIVNTHYFPEQIESHLATRKGVYFSRETSRLETGGGVYNALPVLGRSAFFVLNSDALWVDGPSPALGRLAEAWNSHQMDALLLFQPTVRLINYSGLGDYHLEADGVARRRVEREVAAFIFSGVQILHPRLFKDAPGGVFSLNVLYDKAERDGRLFALVHDGDWYHVGTPKEVTMAEAALTHGDVSVNSR
jgi:N-acetyl-alpha-D-muramate 1-phosphate uridylyltransferase